MAVERKGGGGVKTIALTVALRHASLRPLHPKLFKWGVCWACAGTFTAMGVVPPSHWTRHSVLHPHRLSVRVHLPLSVHPPPPLRAASPPPAPPLTPTFGCEPVNHWDRPLHRPTGAICSIYLPYSCLPPPGPVSPHPAASAASVQRDIERGWEGGGGGCMQRETEWPERWRFLADTYSLAILLRLCRLTGIVQAQWQIMRTRMHGCHTCPPPPPTPTYPQGHLPVHMHIMYARHSSDNDKL